MKLDPHGDVADALRRWLRRTRDPAAALSLDRGSVKAVIDEIGRLQQSNDRLRGQNRRLRRRAGDGEDPTEDPAES